MSLDFFDDLNDLAHDSGGAEGSSLHSDSMAESLSKLGSLIEDINRDMTPETILDRAMSAAIELTGAERGFLVLVESNDEWRFTVARNMEDDIDDAESAASQTIIRRVIEGRQPILINDVIGASDLGRQQSIAKMQVRSLMGAPLISKGKLLGVAYVDTTKLAGVFDQTSLVLFETFVHLAAVALENARLYEVEKDSKARFRDLQEYLATILHSQPHGVLILDREGMVDFANPQAVDLLGGGVRIGAPLERAGCDPSAIAKLRKAHEQFRHTGESERQTLTLRERTLAYSFFRLQRSQDGRERAGLNIEDITSQKSLELQLVESEKRSTVNQLAGGIAHEINNSLQPVKGRIELLSMKLEREGTELSEPIRRDIETITALTDRIEKIARNLRHLTKPSVPDFRVIDMKQLLTSVVDMLESTTGSLRGYSRSEQGSGSSLVLDLEEGLWVYGDPHGLESAIINMIINSVHAMENVETGKLTISAHLAGDRVCVCVADTGVGIPAEKQPKIFEPYYSTKGDRGTGLGMSIVRNIADVHSAELALESEVNVGTRITLSFPLYEEFMSSIR
ncbi:MAG: GAF domain-containing protein [Calditrichaeota bacterium]|nr:GAF domain-containing protein [Calditrichota bacterium]MCB9391962.1 GAF domain-containing protein [Calditrichota bacterium]